jgi:hypothetical protein
MGEPIVTVPEKNGIFGHIDELSYHADRGSLSVSGAKRLLPPSCPAKFKEYRDTPPTPKREYDFGHLAHRLVLGKGADIVEIDAPDYRTKDAREARDKAHANGETPALAHEVDKARVMARRVLEHPRAGQWFDIKRGAAEQSVYATDPLTGVRLRMRADWLWMGAADGRLLCVDYKTGTTANPDELVRKFWQLGYFMQDAWYRRVLTLAKIAADPAFCFVVQEKEPPHLVTIVKYDAEAVAEGERLNRKAIDLYARCRERDEWPSYSDGIVSLSLPHWAFRDSPPEHTTLYDLIELD